MRYRFLLPLAIAFALVAVTPARATGLLDAAISFSATRTVTVNGKPYTGPMFHIPGHERHEQVLLGMQEVFLLDDTQQAGQVILPALKTMIEFPFPPLLAALTDPAMRRDAVGEEKVGDIAATKYRVAQTTPDGTRGEGFLWISRRGVLLKLAGTVTAPGGHRTTIDMALSDVKEAPQNATLFEPPSGLNKLPAEALAPLLGLRLQ
jgi:hypothetical protein